LELKPETVYLRCASPGCREPGPVWTATTSSFCCRAHNRQERLYHEAILTWVYLWTRPEIPQPKRTQVERLRTLAFQRMMRRMPDRLVQREVSP
jgi:hypothetical protein